MTDNVDMYKDLLELFKEVNNPKRTKTVSVKLENSTGQYEFKYAPLEAIIDVVKPLLVKHNFLANQTVEVIDGKSWLLTRLIHVSGNHLDSKIPFPDAIDPRVQNFGGKLTYFKRYGICMALFISAEDDVDGADSKGKFTKPQIKTQISNYMSSIAKAQNMTELMTTHGSFNEVIEYAKVHFPDQIYNKNQDGMSADEYFAFLYKSFRDNDRKTVSIAKQAQDLDEQYKNTVGK